MPVTKTCVICAKVFAVPPVRAASAKTCSPECRGRLIANSYAAKRIKLRCKACDKLFTSPPSHASRRVYCSDACADPNRSNQPSGDRHYRWSGGVAAHSDGYLYLAVAGHPFAKSGNYIFEHRLVMEEWMREREPSHPFLILVEGVSYLRPEISVHHINENKRDNRRSNLLACTNAAHKEIHCGLAPMVGEVWPEIDGLGPARPRYLSRECRSCGRVFRAKWSDVQRGGGKWCSRACYNKRPQNPFQIKFT